MYIEEFFKTRRNVFAAFIFACILLPGCSSSMESGLFLSKVEALKAPLTLGMIRDKFGGFSQGHGPYVWYKSDGVLNDELWFWYLPSREETVLNNLQVVFVSLVNPDNPDDLKIVWPKELKAENAQEVFDLFYGEK